MVAYYTSKNTNFPEILPLDMQLYHSQARNIFIAARIHNFQQTPLWHSSTRGSVDALVIAYTTASHCNNIWVDPSTARPLNSYWRTGTALAIPHIPTGGPVRLWRSLIFLLADRYGSGDPSYSYWRIGTGKAPVRVTWELRDRGHVSQGQVVASWLRRRPVTQDPIYLSNSPWPQSSPS
ncbi:predicted protein [Aspergillus nidulans FGSC A4]|uniref:Uncharacterized protein n=1 Tax=Emericella nidulans (strain FGSC A4 / ATCC 38163 / CBS 112.46 / NRRL 194 / M139) TaxID=227321 RepID=Q5B2G4_EMENI|nr:hypothetical protein [Aspergillus nidulans FGSC A4]EAA62426.1 predicted protein [Aspergillus nidulans FGSC A4]CBF82211.1 TPA: hypothetical protein ANIA_05266 [Aspergillus nidulans FGSC A4]|eukprot:XP_662870.1 predicted protein [Aspergillus nidulans FGSC A4]